MVNADHTQRGALGAGGQDDRHGGPVEGSGNSVHGNRVVGVGAEKSVLAMSCFVWHFVWHEDLRIGAHVANDGQTTVGRREGLAIEERRNGGGKVYAVDEDVCVFDDFPEGAALSIDGQ